MIYFLKSLTYSAEAENEAETAVFVAGATDAEGADFGSVPHMVASAQAVVVVAHAHHTHHIGGSIGQSLQVEAVGSLLLGNETERNGHVGGNHLLTRASTAATSSAVSARGKS